MHRTFVTRWPMALDGTFAALAYRDQDRDHRWQDRDQYHDGRHDHRNHGRHHKHKQRG